MNIQSELLNINMESEIEGICVFIRNSVSRQLHKRGLVIGLSGGIDSSLTAALCVRAVGPSHILGLLMPEKNSSPETLPLSRDLASHLAIDTVTTDITPVLEALDVYSGYDRIVQSVFPEYTSGWKSKIVSRQSYDKKTLTYHSLVAQSPDGRKLSRRIPFREYLGLVATTNYKQRIRKNIEYHHADARNFAVTGTPNRLEYELGFFVKNGDGASDIKPIAHLYKTQVYAMARHLGLPQTILDRPPTTDTFSLPQSQDEFFFTLAYREMDSCLYALNNKIPAKNVADQIGLTEKQVQRVFIDIRTKKRTTAPLHRQPILFQ